MAQLTNNSKDIDSWLEIQYADSTENTTLEVVTETHEFEAIQFSKPYVSMDHAASHQEPVTNLEREVGRVFGILGNHINKLNKAKSAKKPASKKYAEMKRLITELTKDAEAAGIKLDLSYPEEVAEDETIIEEPKEDLAI